MIIEDTQALRPEQRQALLERMGVEDRLRGLAAEDRLRGLATEDRLRGLDPEQVKAWLKRTGHQTHAGAVSLTPTITTVPASIIAPATAVTARSSVRTADPTGARP